MNNLGSLYQDQLKLEEAEVLYRRALEGELFPKILFYSLYHEIFILVNLNLTSIFTDFIGILFFSTFFGNTFFLKMKEENMCWVLMIRSR